MRGGVQFSMGVLANGDEVQDQLVRGVSLVTL